MKKLLSIILVLALLTIGITACNGDSDSGGGNSGTSTTAGGGNNPTPNPTEPSVAEEITGAIAVIAREEGSGTRGAFVELFDVRGEAADGSKFDDTRVTATAISSGGTVITNVATNKQAIGYISVASLDPSVKALKIDGVEATTENVLNDSYKIHRPFNIVFQEDSLSELAEDFIDFIMSEEGQTIVGKRAISEGNTGTYVSAGIKGTLMVVGSSSISPVMEDLIAGYEAVNDGVKIELQSNDSGTGVRSAADGSADIGMVSRDVRQEELDQGITDLVIAIDAIAVIVHAENALEGLTSEQVREIFIEGGSVTTWEGTR
jgi:phosphate transport system substrate-binding protein